ncbi:MAG TPA: esterase [Verrucomicrobia bacterium]|nr:esterase [Verrucomicrobiota bacterium]
MALVRIDHYPETLQVNTAVYLILPDSEDLQARPLDQTPVLWLLHGLSDDASAWQRYTNLETLARELDFVAIMPSGGRSLYADQANGQAYFTYLMEELPFYLQALFKLNMSRENSCIAGNSMGGYGAFKAALNYPDRFRAAFSLSGALALGPAIDKSKAASNPQLMHEMGMVFGGLEKITGSINDPLHWLEMAQANPEALPDLYAVCGDQDDLLPANRFFIAAAQRAGIPVNYREEPGRHDWYFWQAHLEGFIREVLMEGAND